MAAARRRYAALTAGMLLISTAVHAQEARLRLQRLETLAGRATQVVDITLDSSLLRLAGGLLSDRQPEESAVRELIQGIREIHVRSYQFGTRGGYSDSDVQEIRQQLANPPWIRIVGVRSQGKGENVEVYVWREKDNDRTDGIAIVAAEPHELTVVNIVGSIDLNRLVSLSGQFGIPRLTLPPKPKD